MSLNVTGNVRLTQKIRFPEEETTCKAVGSHEERNLSEELLGVFTSQEFQKYENDIETKCLCLKSAGSAFQAAH